MKTSFLLFLFLPLLTFSQKENAHSAAEKPATDACPTWKKKKTNSKAEYFNYLRSAKPKQQQLLNGSSQSFDQPHYRKPVSSARSNEQQEEVIVKQVAEKTIPLKSLEVIAPLPQNKIAEPKPLVEDEFVMTPENKIEVVKNDSLSPEKQHTVIRNKRTGAQSKLNSARIRCPEFFHRKKKVAKCADF